MNNPTSPERPPTAAYSKKICLLGDFAVGKTSLVRKFVYDIFDDKYISTIGVKVSRKTVAVITDGGVAELTMMLWDLAGSEDFNDIRASYLRGSAGAILVCDLTRPETLANLRAYVRDLRGQIADPKLVLAANKVDLQDELRISEAEIVAVAEELGTSLIFTSAKTGQGVEEIFRTLGSMLI